MLEDQPGMGHGKMGWLVSDPQVFWSSAAERNKAFIGETIADARFLSVFADGIVLEIGSGSGQHVSFLATILPHLHFLPTEYPGHPSPRAQVRPDLALTSP